MRVAVAWARVAACWFESRALRGARWLAVRTPCCGSLVRTVLLLPSVRQYILDAALPHRASVDVWELDLAKLGSVKRFAHRFLATGMPLHVLVNNAGVGGLWQERRTENKFETTFQVNHLSHFLLTNMLLTRYGARSGFSGVALHAGALGSRPDRLCPCVCVRVGCACLAGSRRARPRES